MLKRFIVATMIVAIMASAAVAVMPQESEVDATSTTIYFYDDSSTLVDKKYLQDVGLDNPYVISSDMDPPTIRKPGYALAGWYEKTNLTGNPVKTIENSGGEKNYYAKWVLANYEFIYTVDPVTIDISKAVTIYVDGSAISTSGTVTIENSIKIVGSQGYDISYSVGSTENLVKVSRDTYKATGLKGDGNIPISIKLTSISLVFDPDQYPNLTIDGDSKTTSPQTVTLTSEIKLGDLARGYAIDSTGGMTYNGSKSAYFPDGSQKTINLTAKAIVYNLYYHSLKDHNALIYSDTYTVEADKTLKTTGFSGYTDMASPVWWYDPGKLLQVFDNVMKCKSDGESFSLGDKDVYADYEPIKYELSIGKNVYVKINTTDKTNPSTDTTIKVTKGDKIYIWASDGYQPNITNLKQYPSSGTPEYYILNTAEDASVVAGPLTYNVTYVMNGGSLNGASSYKTFTPDNGLTLPQHGVDGVTITKSGYKFKDWYAEPTCKTSAVTKIPAGTVGNQTFYADWTPLNFTIDMGDNVVAQKGGEPVVLEKGKPYPTDFVKQIVFRPASGYSIDPSSPGLKAGEEDGTYVIDTGGNVQDVKVIVTAIEYVIIIQTEDHGTPAEGAIEVYVNDKKEPAKSGIDKVTINDKMNVKLSGNYNMTVENMTSIVDYKQYVADANGNPTFTVTPKFYKIYFDEEEFDVYIGSEKLSDESEITIEDTLIITPLKSGTVLSVPTNLLSLGSDKYRPTGGDVTLETELIQYVITYHFNDMSAGWAEGFVPKTSYTTEESFDLPTKDNVKLGGYDFNGWHLKPDLSDNKVTTIEAGHTGDLDLYAEWTPCVYKVTMMVDDVQYGSTFNVTYGKAYGSDLVDPILSGGNQFVAWQLESGVRVSPTSIVTTAEDHEVHAIYSTTKYEVIYNLDELLVYNNATSTLINNGDLVLKETKLVLKFTPGYTLDKNNTTGIDLETFIVDGSSQTVHIYAILQQYYVTIGDNIECVKTSDGKTIKTTPLSGSPVGDTVTLNTSLIITFKNGYVIDSHDGTEMISINEFKVSGNSPKTLNDGKKAVYFTAKEREEIAFQIFFNEQGTQQKFLKVYDVSDGGSVELKSEDLIFKGDLLKFELEPGYELDLESTGSLKLSDKTNMIYTATGGDIHCISKAIKYSINYIMEIDAYWDAGFVPTYTYTINDSVVFDASSDLFKKVKRDGYEFKGWYSDKTLETPMGNIPVGSQGDVSVYPKWSAKTISITYVCLDDPIDGVTFQKKYGSLYGELDVPESVVGVQFLGWCLLDPSVPENKELLASNMIDSESVVLTPDDHKLYAVTKKDVSIPVYFEESKDTMVITYLDSESKTVVVYTGDLVPINTLLSITFTPGYSLTDDHPGIEILADGAYKAIGPEEAHLATEKIDYYVVSDEGIKDIKLGDVTVTDSTIVHVGDQLVVTYKDGYMVDTYIAVSSMGPVDVDSKETFTVNGIGYYLMKDGRKAVAFSTKTEDSNYYTLTYSGHITDALKYDKDGDSYVHIDTGSKVNVQDKLMFVYDTGYTLDVESTGNIKLELGKDDIYRPTGGNIVCVAKPIQYSILYVFSSSDAHWSDGFKPVTEYNIETATFSLPTADKAERIGMVLAGWQDPSGKSVASVEKGTYGNLTFYAVWTSNDIQVTYVCAGDSDLNGTSFTVGYGNPYGSTEGGLKTPFVDGVKFVGWYTTNDPDKQTDATLVTAATLMKKAEDHSIYAKYAEPMYKVRYEPEHITDVMLVKGKEYVPVTPDTEVTMNDILVLKLEDGYVVDNHIGTNALDNGNFVVTGKEYALLKDGNKAVLFTAKEKDVEIQTKTVEKIVEKIVEVEKTFQVDVDLDGGGANNIPEGWTLSNEVYSKYFLPDTPIADVMEEWNGADIYKSGYALAGWDSQETDNYALVTIKYGDQNLIPIICGVLGIILVITGAVFYSRYERN